MPLLPLRRRMVANSPNTIKRYRQRYLKYLEPSILNKKKKGTFTLSGREPGIR